MTAVVPSKLAQGVQGFVRSVRLRDLRERDALSVSSAVSFSNSANTVRRSLAPPAGPLGMTDVIPNEHAQGVQGFVRSVRLRNLRESNALSVSSAGFLL